MYNSPKLTCPFLLSNSKSKILENKNPLSNKNVSTSRGELMRIAFWTNWACSSKNFIFWMGPPNMNTSEWPPTMKNIAINLIPLMLLNPLSSELGCPNFLMFSEMENWVFYFFRPHYIWFEWRELLKYYAKKSLSKWIGSFQMSKYKLNFQSVNSRSRP